MSIVEHYPDNNAMTTARKHEGQGIVQSPMEMIAIAVERGDIQIVEKLMELEERWQSNMGRRAFDAAIAAAKAEIPTIQKNKQVGFTSKRTNEDTNYRYEDMAEISETVGPILSRHGLSYRYKTKTEGQTVSVTCVLSHRDGYSEETTLSASPDNSGKKNSIQAVGSAITYLQRYTIKAALGLAAGDRDDDGESFDAPAKVNEDQIGEIRALMESVGADEARFLQYCSTTWKKDIGAIADIPAEAFTAAMGFLAAKAGK